MEEGRADDFEGDSSGPGRPFSRILPKLLPRALPRRKPNALDLAEGDPALTAAVLRCRKMLHRRALAAAAASATPIPGLDWAVDAALLSRMVPQINAEFGLSAEQIARLDPSAREDVQKAVGVVGSMLIGKFITKDLVMKAAQTVGLRLTTQQLSKYVPFAGQAVAAAIGYSAIRYLGEQHMKDCVRVAKLAQVSPPALPLATRVPLLPR
ncbi:MAG: hypothetical protein ABI589_10075 [Burkholderiales bacterium]